MLYPSDLVSSSSNLNMWFFVPKFHLPTHIPKCQADYSFNLTLFIGRTDGEAPEHGWSEANAMAVSTKEIGPGSCCDTLDDHFGDHNWGKIANMGIHN